MQTWAELFERASEYETTESAIREALAERRAGRDAEGEDA